MKITLETEFPLAKDSPDYIQPWGTRRDNSKNIRFNKKLCRLFGDDPIRILDLGCAGGGFVQSVIEDGHIGVGLEGSDWSKNLGRGAWGKIQTLFTCDITKPFLIYDADIEHYPTQKVPFYFNIITAWDVLEHIREEDLSQLIENIHTHLSFNGLFICSIDDGEEIINKVQLHQTIKTRNWWIEKFKENELYNIPDLIPYFNKQFIRGGKYDRSFNLVLTHPDPDVWHYERKLSMGQRLMDKWHGSVLQRRLKTLICG